MNDTNDPTLHAATAGAATERGESIREQVRAGYAQVATGDERGCGCGPSCCTPGATAVSERIGYDADELAALPAGTDMGLSCGNPTALASLRPGEVVLDLGAGGGLDVFLAGPKVGRTGRAIGVDMTPEMVTKARRGLAVYRERSGLDNVEFRLGEIEHLPVGDASVDVVISNCVINLSPDKPQVWREIARVLRPGGRVAVSDLVLLRLLPPAVVGMLESWVGCIAGASLIDDVRAMAAAAGLADLAITTKPDYVAALADLQDPLYRRIAEHLPDDTSLAAFVTSASITATRPRGRKESAVTTLEVFDAPMCCATGVCGPSVDPALVRFAGDLDWLRARGVVVTRANLAQEPDAFVRSAVVHARLERDGPDCLPLVVVDGVVVASGAYPDRETLARFVGRVASVPEPAPAEPGAAEGGCGCGPGGCG